MPFNAPLSIRINDGTIDRHVTKYASGLQFTKTAPGGHRDCQFHLNLPEGTFRDLGPQDKCWVYSNTGRTIFGAAYLENPTPLDGYSGQSYDINAFGGMALANDESNPLIYVTSDLTDFTQGGTYTSGSVGTNADGLRIQVNSGNTIATSNYVGAGSTVFGRAGMGLGAVRLESYSGKTDTGYQVGAFLGSGGMVIGDLTPRITTSHVVDTKWVGTDFAAGALLLFYLQRIGAATNVTDDDTWVQIDGLSAAGQRMDRTGTLLTGATDLVSATQVLASQVVEDLLGRVLTMCDPATATIDATTFGIDQLAYPDGVKAATVLTDLADYEPDYWWGIGADGPNGLHEFWYRAWATAPRYVVSVADGWVQVGSDADLCNRVVVYYTDAEGNRQQVVVTADDLGLTGIGLPVDALGSRVKDAEPVTLPDGRGSAANAAQVGAAVLRDKIDPPLAGRVTVRRKILDLLTGCEVAPWELEPGWPVTVREKGITLRCTQMTYVDDSVAATLTLGTPRLTDEQRLARLARVA
jgi:hypothetical protein